MDAPEITETESSVKVTKHNDLVSASYRLTLAEQRLIDGETSKTYIGGHGAPEFGERLLELCFGNGNALLADGLLGATQTPGASPSSVRWSSSQWLICVAAKA